MNLTITFNQDYHPAITVKPVIGFDIPDGTANSRQRSVERLFCCLSVFLYGRAEQGPQGRRGSTGMSTCSSLPTRLTSRAVRLTNLEHTS